MGLDFSPEKPGIYRDRIAVCYLVIFIFFFLVAARLAYLQIVRGRYFWVFSAEHTMKEIRIPSTRGIIYDRNRIPIAENRPSFDVTLIPQEIREIEKVKRALGILAGIGPETIDQKLGKTTRHLSYYPVAVATDIPYEKAVRIRAAQAVGFQESDPGSLQGVEVLARPLRSYPGGAIAAVTLGYIGEISERDLARFQKESPGRYLMGDLMGASGLERFWERELRGEDGYVQKIVDAVGREIINPDLEPLLTRAEARHGHDLILTLDSRLQEFAEKRFGEQSGSLVAIDPRTGGILAIVSLPSYDPASLVSNISRDYWLSLSEDPRKLLLNRAIQGSYPPGSTYKIVTAIASLEEGVVKPDDKISCGGGLKYGNRFFKCWNKGGHGPISLRRAIAESCDTYFYTMGLRLGVDRLAKYARLLGLGEKTGVEVEGEKGGTIPTSEWKKRLFKQEWQPGENLSIAVGQGYDTVTPLQNALMVSRVASGKRVEAHLVGSVENDEGEVLLKADSKEPEELPLKKETLDLVRSGMMDAVQSPSGTAHRSQSAYFKMAGKTGTAQVMSEEAKGRARAGVNTRDHAWFIAFAPVEDPRIAVNVLVEHGGFGASAAAPIAKDVVEKYLELEGLIKVEASKRAGEANTSEQPGASD